MWNITNNISPAMLFSPRSPRINLTTSLIEMPPVSGSATAGAYAGSKASKSQLIYVGPLLLSSPVMRRISAITASTPSHQSHQFQLYGNQHCEPNHLDADHPLLL